jgi:ankyrin repeat protein
LGRYALHEAAAYAKADTVRELLTPREVSGWRAWLQPAPLRVDERTTQGRTALHFAAQSAAGEASHAVVATLLQYGAEVNSADSIGCTPLMLAAAIGDARMCELLLASGADPNAATTGASEDFDLLETPLVAAAWDGHEDAVKVLLQGGAVTEQRLATGNTALHEAVEAEQVAVVRQLVTHGADSNARGRDKGATPLHVAVWKFSEKRAEASPTAAIATVLIEHGADVSLEDERGHSAVHHATEDGKPTMLKLLLDAAAKNAWVPGGKTGLSLAQVHTRDGLPPLHLALHGGKGGKRSAVRAAKACAEVLLAAGANLEEVDGYGGTVLHWTAHESDEELTRYTSEAARHFGLYTTTNVDVPADG